MAEQIDKHDPASMAAWLRERAKANREVAALSREQWPYHPDVQRHFALRFEQAAEMIEGLARGEHICTRCYLRMLPPAFGSDQPEPDPLF